MDGMDTVNDAPTTRASIHSGVRPAGFVAGAGGFVGVGDAPLLSTQPAAKLSAQTRPISIGYSKRTHKRSRIKKGWLIKRLTGYSIAETEYGVSYLWVLSRKPDVTTADNSVYPLAGYFNWKSLEASELLIKERKSK